MTIRTHTIEKKNPQHNQEWSWDETPEFVDALLKLETATELRKNLEKKNSKNNQEWSWEETPEVLAALEQLHKSSEEVKDV